MTTKQTGHTPGPWHLGVQEEPQETVVGRIPLMASLQYVDTGMRIADIWWSKTNEGRANAVFIITACNSHYELLEALKMVAHVDYHGELCWCDEDLWDYRAHDGKHCEYCNKAKQAISKA